MPRGGARPGAGRKPGKVSAAKRSLMEMAGAHAELALLTLVEICKDKEQPSSARVSASTALLDRAYGKPPQAISGVEGEPLGLTVQIVRFGREEKAEG
jgi:hypothetical protein